MAGAASVRASIFSKGGRLSALTSHPVIASSTPTVWAIASRTVQAGHSDWTSHSSGPNSAHSPEMAAKHSSVLSINSVRTADPPLSRPWSFSPRFF